MRPFTAYQASVNADVVAALAELSRDVAETRDERPQSGPTCLAGRVARGRADGGAATSAIEEIKRILTLETDRSVYLALAELRERHLLIAASARRGWPATRR